MARLPYASLDDPALQPLVERITAERGSVLHLYQMLLHSPPLAQGWLAFFTALRQRLDLPGDLRELVIMRIAHLNGAPYEAEQHRPIALREGLAPEQLDALPDWEASTTFTPAQQRVLRLTDAITREIHFDEALLQAVRADLGERQTVELVATVAGYNLVSRFLEALQIHSHDAR
ncbi:MAG: carboxymuconolactone decarboxylase family protein [Rubrivivax sp.]